MQETKSTFIFYSFAIAAQNKHLDSDIVYALPIEVTPFVEGELDAEIETVEGIGEDHYEEEYTVSVKKDNAVMASWLPLHNTNRRTSPDIRRGERLLLYRMADSQDFYWVSMGKDDNLRRLETVIYSWSATDREEDDATDPDFCYSFEVCTHTRQVTFRTVRGIDHGGKGTKEPFAYTLQFNTDYGAVVLTDDDGNYFELDSTETRLLLRNKFDTIVHLDKRRVLINGDEEVRIKSGATEQVWTPGGVRTYTPRFEGIKSTSDSGFKPINTGAKSPKGGL